MARNHRRGRSHGNSLDAQAPERPRTRGTVQPAPRATSSEPQVDPELMAAWSGWGTTLRFAFLRALDHPLALGAGLASGGATAPILNAASSYAHGRGWL